MLFVYEDEQLLYIKMDDAYFRQREIKFKKYQEKRLDFLECISHRELFIKSIFIK